MEHNQHEQPKKTEFLTLFFRLIVGVLGSVFTCMLILKFTGNFYVFLVILPLADFFIWRSLIKKKYPKNGKWVLYGAMGGVTFLLIILILALVGINVAAQGVLG